MDYFYINGVNFSDMVSGLKVGYETLVSGESGRNAAGDTVIDIVSRKYKLYVTFRHTTADEMASLLQALSGYVVTVKFSSPHRDEGDGFTTITAYTGTPNPEYYTIQPTHTIFKPMQLNFIEL